MQHALEIAAEQACIKHPDVQFNGIKLYRDGQKVISVNIRTDIDHGWLIHNMGQIGLKLADSYTDQKRIWTTYAFWSQELQD